MAFQQANCIQLCKLQLTLGNPCLCLVTSEYLRASCLNTRSIELLQLSTAFDPKLKLFRLELEGFNSFSLPVEALKQILLSGHKICIKDE